MSIGDAQVAHATLRGVTRVYPGVTPVHALGPLDLDLARGEFFSVVGPSGCGKSTLLDVLAGLNPPTAGTVSFEGRAVVGEVPDGIGVVFQEDASFPWLTVRDNVAFGLRRAGTEPAEIARRVAYAIGFMGLDDFAGAYPAQLSGGMRQRVCIARTLVSTAATDPAGRAVRSAGPADTTIDGRRAAATMAGDRLHGDADYPRAG